MVKPKGTLRTCRNGHQYYKSSDCLTCPVCEAEKKPKDGFLALLSNPARNALQHAGIKTLKQVALKTEKEILSLHGVGPSTIPVLKKALKNEGLKFKK